MNWLQGFVAYMNGDESDSQYWHTNDHDGIWRFREGCHCSYCLIDIQKRRESRIAHSEMG